MTGFVLHSVLLEIMNVAILLCMQNHSGIAEVFVVTVIYKFALTARFFLQMLSLTSVFQVL